MSWVVGRGPSWVWVNVMGKKIGPQCVRVATAFLLALVCEYGAV